MFCTCAIALIHVLGAGECAAKSEGSTLMDFTIDIPFDGLGLIGFPASDAISPVYTLWVTLVLMYLGAAHCLFSTRQLYDPILISHILGCC